MERDYLQRIVKRYRGEMSQPEFGPGHESLEVGLFAEAEIPWEQIAFPSIEVCLRHYFKDRIEGKFPVHVEDIHRRPPATFKT